jgi:hypothetical protein
MRVTSGSWDGEKVILRDQVLEVSKVEGRLHVARKPLHHDEGNPQIEPYGGGGCFSARLCPAQSGQVQLEHGPMGAMLPWSETSRW